MKIEPIFTEKSMKLAKNGIYSFRVEKKLGKDEIKKLIADLFKVSVVKVKTLTYRKEKRRNYQGKKVEKPAYKKALVTLSGKDKIDIFETESKSKTK